MLPRHLIYFSPQTQKMLAPPVTNTFDILPSYIIHRYLFKKIMQLGNVDLTGSNKII